MKLVGQMALTALILGTVSAVLGTGRVTIPLVFSTALVWSFVPVVQVLTGLVLLRGNARDGQPFVRYFATGRYWSVWSLVLAVVMLLGPNGWTILNYALLTCAVPIALTAHALVRLRREVFGDSVGGARRRVLLHQVMTHVILILYIGWAAALWPRIVALVNW